ncbi:MAG: hypothetical protein H0W73_11255 [Bacteroidetes bacterium]|nr:hypothetical protein [Bacteroidota bacterium]
MTSTTEITQHRFNFKGFALTINDDVADEKGNHLLVGKIHASENEEANRDTLINRLFGLKGVVYDDKIGILISTDKNYKIIQIARSFIGEKIIYNAVKKQFTVGANFFDYLKVGERSFSAWQPVIIKTNIQLKAQAYFVQKPYSCILKNIFIENEEILILTRSNINDTNNKSDEKAEVIRVSVSKTHKDEKREWIKVLDIISATQTPYEDHGRMEISEVSKKDNGYYFTTSNLDQSTLKNANHLYRFARNKLTDVAFFGDFLKLSHNYSDWVNINDFFATQVDNYTSLTHVGASKKEITFSVTDTSFNALLQKKIKLNDYADYDKMLLLPNKNIVVLSVNKTEMWSYYIYDQNMVLLKEINSNVSKKYYPQNLKVMPGNKLECIFYIDNISQKDCVLQLFSLD